MDMFKGINAAVSFFLELGILISLSFFGFYGDKPTIVKILLGVVLPVLVIVFWSYYMAPKSNHRLKPPIVRTVALVLFLLSAVALYISGQQSWGIGFAVVAIVNILLASIWKQ